MMILGGNVAVKNKLVHGVGINDADYVLRICEELPRTNGKQNQKIVWRCPFYSRWMSMLRRCYSKAYQEKQPTYKGCSVCEEWLIFSNFKSWMETQDWEGKHLDKDLLVYRNKVYSTETCVFIALNINAFLVKRDKCRGDYPLGVSYYTEPRMINPLKHPYIAKIGNKGKLLYLGSFNTPEEAHQAWQKEKIKQAQDLAAGQTDERIVQGLLRVANKIQYDLDNNLETKDF